MSPAMQPLHDELVNVFRRSFPASVNSRRTEVFSDAPSVKKLGSRSSSFFRTTSSYLSLKSFSKIASSSPERKGGSR